MHTGELRTIARHAAKAEMVKGFLWFIGAVVVTGVTYLAADPGGSYVVFWGAIAYGGYRLLRAIYYWLNPNALVKRI